MLLDRYLHSYKLVIVRHAYNQFESESVCECVAIYTFSMKYCQLKYFKEIIFTLYFMKYN